MPNGIHVSGITIHEKAIAMNRIIEPELLDELPPDDPRARWSRCDLRRVNAWMRNHAIMARALQAGANGEVPRQLVEFGAGDGRLLLRVARKLSPRWRDIKVTLLDRHRNVTPQTLAAFASLGWRAEIVEADVFDWLDAWERRLPASELPDAKSDGRQDADAPGVIVANLFLHHFEDARLKELFRAVASRVRLFVAIEPRRGLWPLFWCRWIWAIGCNSVTRHDARVSVHAGFSGQELSALWPADRNWEVAERRTGSFSHLFVARKIPASECADLSAPSQAATRRCSSG